ncbi:hypothetical protein Tco_1357882 [Tanacetum coccineum]
MTPATPNSGLVPNPPPLAPFVPPSRHEWDLVFQPVFDEFFSTPASVTSPVPVEEAPTPVESTGSPSLIIVNQDTPSPSTSQTTTQSQSRAIPLNAEEESHDLEVAHMIEPKTYKDALTQSCWIEAMQEELHEFERFSKGTVDPTLFISRKGKDILLSPRGIFLNQSKYALESLKKYGMKSCDPVDTPMVGKSKLDEDTQGKAVDPTHYRGMVVTLMYLTSSRPDLDSAIALKAFADADHAGCQDTRCSTSGKQVENGVVELYFVRTEYQLRGIFTKALCRERIKFFIDKLGIGSFTLETLKELADEAEE